MTRHDDERVRPVPIDDDPPPVRGHVDEQQTRRGPVAVPIALAVVTIAIAAAALVGFGTLDGSAEPAGLEQAQDFTQTAYDQAQHSQLLIAAEADQAGWSVVWDSSPDVMSLGSIGAIPDPSSVSRPASSSDASASFRAVGTCIGATCGIEVVRTDDPNTQIAFVEADSYAWHTNDPHRIAWASPTDGLVAAHVDPATNELVVEARLRLPTDAPELIIWDTLGFIVTGDATVALENDGTPMWHEQGRALDVDAIVATVARNDDWALIDRRDGQAAVVIDPAGGRLTLVNSKTSDDRSDTTATGFTFSTEIAEPGQGEAPQASKERDLPISADAGSEYRIFRGADNGIITIVFETSAMSSAGARG